MTLWLLIVREIRLRWAGFGLAVTSVLAAVAVLTAQVTLLDAHDASTQRILAEKQAETESEMGRMEGDYRKIMKELGFNLLILPAGQSLEEFYAEGRVTADMPEQYATKLAGAGLMTINHLVPALERNIRWPEEGRRPIVLVGMRGEVPLARGKAEEPMMVPVPPGSAVIGDEIRRSLGLKVGGSITLLGRRFVVHSCLPERGTKDDITIWIDLRQAQEMLGAPGRINSILALQCLCEGSDIASIRRDVGKLLPGVQVIELASRALTRAEARGRAAAAAKTAIEAERAHRARLRRDRESLMAWLLPLVTLGAALWVGLLAFMNVRERIPEIGILRALGLRSRQIAAVFLARAALAGLAGAVLGYGVGFATGVVSGEAAAAALFRPGLLGLVVLTAPVVAAVASLPPAIAAASHDPAAVLRSG
jgi:putative ABC transport system permease protein